MNTNKIETCIVGTDVYRSITYQLFEDNAGGENEKEGA